MGVDYTAEVAYGVPVTVTEDAIEKWDGILIPYGSAYSRGSTQYLVGATFKSTEFGCCQFQPLDEKVLAKAVSNIESIVDVPGSGVTSAGPRGYYVLGYIW